MLWIGLRPASAETPFPLSVPVPGEVIPSEQAPSNETDTLSESEDVVPLAQEPVQAPNEDSAPEESPRAAPSSADEVQENPEPASPEQVPASEDTPLRASGKDAPSLESEESDAVPALTSPPAELEVSDDLGAYLPSPLPGYPWCEPSDESRTYWQSMEPRTRPWKPQASPEAPTPSTPDQVERALHLEAPAVESLERPTISTARAIRAILALVIFMMLAYLAGHPFMQRLEQRLRITSVITAGFPFVILGLVAASESADLLSPDIMQELRPLLPLGLGWIGFTVGFRFDLRRFEALPQGTSAALVLTTLLPFAAMVGVTSAFFGATEGVDKANFVRDAVILAAAGAMTARILPGVLAARGASPQTVERVSRIIQLEELIAFAGIIVVTAFFRPDANLGGWRVPAVGWVFVTIGLSCILGAFIFAMMRAIKNNNEILVVMLGAICFAGGMASHLHLSPIVVCFLAGVLLSNLPGEWKERVLAVLIRLERPIYLIFLVIIGAMWDVAEWKGWLLALLFVATRLSTRLLGVRVFTERYPDSFSPVEQRNLATSPMGALGIAIIINMQDLYGGGLTTSWLVTAVLVGSLITEIAVQFASMGKAIDELEPIAPIRSRATVERMTAIGDVSPPADALSLTEDDSRKVSSDETPAESTSPEEAAAPPSLPASLEAASPSQVSETPPPPGQAKQGEPS